MELGLLLVIVGGGFVSMLVVVLLLVRHTSGSAGDLAGLAQRFPAPTSPTGPTFRAQLLRLAGFSYRYKVTIVATAEGLCLLPEVPDGQPSHAGACVPWSEIRSTRTGSTGSLEPLTVMIVGSEGRRLSILRSTAQAIPQLAGRA